MEISWQTIKLVLLAIVGGVLWFLGWLFGKKNSPVKVPDTKEKEKEAARKEGRVEVKEEAVENKLDEAEKNSEKAEEHLKEADKIREEIEKSKEEEKELLENRETYDDATPDEIDDEFKKRGY
jgi:flagellar motility protein MotE (MotC chaperone)